MEQGKPKTENNSEKRQENLYWKVRYFGQENQIIQTWKGSRPFEARIVAQLNSVYNQPKKPNTNWFC